jgi:uncharacterized membrane protein
MFKPLRLKRYFFTGLLVLIPAGGTFFILRALFRTVDNLLVDLMSSSITPDVPGLGLLSLLALILLTGVIATHVLGQRLVSMAEEWVRRIPLVRPIYLTLKGMADLFNFRERFGRSRVVVFPFPREGLWALGFVMGTVPAAIAAVLPGPMQMVFVPTAIHPFTGYLAFVPRERIVPINLEPEDAMKMEFSAGLFRPSQAWLVSPDPSYREP